MIIRLNKKIYSEQIVKRAIKDYRHLANFEFGQNKNYFLVKIDQVNLKLKDRITDEFLNYILSLMKK